ELEKRMAQIDVEVSADLHSLSGSLDQIQAAWENGTSTSEPRLLRKELTSLYGALPITTSPPAEVWPIQAFAAPMWAVWSPLSYPSRGSIGSDPFHRWMFSIGSSAAAVMIACECLFEFCHRSCPEMSPVMQLVRGVAAINPFENICFVGKYPLKTTLDAQERL